MSAQVVVGKLNRAIVPWLLSFAMVCYLDRNNLAYGALQMTQDLSMDCETYGLGAGTFYVGYTVAQLPMSLAMMRVGAPRWLGGTCSIWGALAVAFAFVPGPRSFLLLRFLLGVAESSSFPGMWHHLSLFYSAKEMTSAYPKVSMANTASSVVGAPLAALILTLDGALGLRGWQWLFVVEGFMAIAFGALLWRFLPAGPATASFLTPPERVWLADRQQGGKKPPTSLAGSTGAGDGPSRGPGPGRGGPEDPQGPADLPLPTLGSHWGLTEVEGPENSEPGGRDPLPPSGPLEAPDPHSLRSTLASLARVGRDWRVLWLAAVWCAVGCAMYGLMLWMPLIVRSLLGDAGGAASPPPSPPGVLGAEGGCGSAGSGASDTRVLLLSAVPYALAAASMNIVGASSERRDERRWHSATPLALAAAALAGSAALSRHPGASFALIALSVGSVWGFFGPFFSWPAQFLTKTDASVAYTVINTAGSVGGFLGPWMIGFLAQATGSFGSAQACLALLLALAALALALLPAEHRHGAADTIEGE